MSATGRAWARAGALAAVVLALDQLTKALVRDGVALTDDDGPIVYVRNKGVAFGAFEDQVAVVIVVIAIAVLALLVYFARHAAKPYMWVPTGLLAGGAVGNIFDRVRDGAVTDFIKLPAWPAFNIADIAITFGVIALVLALEQNDRAADRGS
ncbi:MAG TPA: signal peptidase II [Solirubrobacteraceae bacterium]